MWRVSWHWQDVGHAKLCEECVQIVPMKDGAAPGMCLPGGSAYFDHHEDAETFHITDMNLPKAEFASDGAVVGSEENAVSVDSSTKAGSSAENVQGKTSPGVVTGVK